MSENPVNDALQKKAERGEIPLIDPLDYRIMEYLPLEGTTQSGLYPIGTVVREIAKSLGLESSFVSGRVRIMNFMGLTVKIQALGTTKKGKWAWQLSHKGAEVLAAWKEKQSGS